MKLKYYLRGLGIGVAVTACILGLTASPREMTDEEVIARAKQLGMTEEEGVLSDMADTLEETENTPQEENKETDTTPIQEGEESADQESEEAAAQDSEKTAAQDSEKTAVPESEKDADQDSEEAADQKNEKTTVQNSEKATDQENKTAAAQNSDKAAVQGNEDTDTGALQTNGDTEEVENYIVITINSGNGSGTVSQKLYEAGLVNSAADYDRYLTSNGYDRKLKVGNHEIPAGATEEEIARIICGMN
jgi:outer membrane biosynthesis protein TonB